MATYRVHMTMSISTTVDVEADSIETAITSAQENGPVALNSSNHGIDESGEWEAVAVYDEHDVEVWDNHLGEVTD